MLASFPHQGGSNRAPAPAGTGAPSLVRTRQNDVRQPERTTVEVFPQFTLQPPDQPPLPGSIRSGCHILQLLDHLVRQWRSSSVWPGQVSGRMTSQLNGGPLWSRARKMGGGFKERRAAQPPVPPPRPAWPHSGDRLPAPAVRGSPGPAGSGQSRSRIAGISQSSGHHDSTHSNNPAGTTIASAQQTRRPLSLPLQPSC